MTAILPPVQSVLDLFQGPLESVRFADIDAAGLSKLATEVEAAAAEVERQESVLTELRQGLLQRQEALLTLAQQALAYARVYADGDESLLDELNRITLPRAPKPRKPSAPRATSRDTPRDETSEATSEAAVESAEASILVETDTDASTGDAAATNAAASNAAASNAAAESDAAPAETPSAPGARPHRGGRKGRNATAHGAA